MHSGAHELMCTPTLENLYSKVLSDCVDNMVFTINPTSQIICCKLSNLVLDPTAPLQRVKL